MVQGFGTALVATMLAEPALNEIEEFFAGVERGNVASEQLLNRCGFRAVSGEDGDGFTYSRFAVVSRTPVSPR